MVTIVSGLAWGLGYFGMPQVLIRFMSATHSCELRKSRRIATVWVVISLFSAVSIGLIGRAVIPTEFLTQASAESVFIVLSNMILPSFMCGLVVSPASSQRQCPPRLPTCLSPVRQLRRTFIGD